MTIFNRFAVCSALFALSLWAPALQGSVARAQTPPLSFEVASVKPNKSGDINTRLTGGRNGSLTAENATVKTVIRQAYGVQPSQIVGGPAWLDADRFDINAKAEGEPTQARLMSMLQSLLADRFKLVVRKDTREIPVYALVLARPNGTLGPQLRRSDVDCAALARGGTPPPPGPPTAASQGRPMTKCSTRISGGMMASLSTTMEKVARDLTGSVDRIVVDRTGLMGVFDLDLIWTPEPTPELSGPSIFTALQEQLGLKLDPARAPIDVIVIDRIEPPSPD